MRFNRVHKSVIFLIALMGAFPLLRTSELSGFVPWVYGMMIVAGWFFKETWVQKTVFQWSVSAALVIFFVFQLWRIQTGFSPVVAILEFGLMVLSARMCVRLRYTDDQQIVVLSFVALLGGTIVGYDLLYGFVVVLFMVLVPFALMLTHLRKEIEVRFSRDPDTVQRLMKSQRVLSYRGLIPVVWMGCLTLLVTFLLFVSIPRLGIGYGANLLRPSLPGFSPEVRIGDLEETMENTSIYLRLIPLDEPANRRSIRNVRLRGVVYDVYREGTWVQSDLASFRRLIGEGPGDMFLFRLPKTRVTPVRFRVLQESIHPPVLFFPVGTFIVRSGFVHDGGVRRPRHLEINDAAVLRYEDWSGSGSRHEVWMGNAPIPHAAEMKSQRWLALPDGMEPLVELAARFAGSGSAEVRARRILEELGRQYQYARTLTPEERRRGVAASPLENFLFHYRKGTCEHFATAAVLMLRAEGIPARYVTGFLGAKWNPFGEYWSVGADSAHAWAEMYLNDEWVTADATPAATGSGAPAAQDRITVSMILDMLTLKWQDHVIDYDLNVQRRLLDSFREGVSQVRHLPGLLSPMRGFLLLPGLLGLAVLLWWGMRRKRFLQRPRRGADSASSDGRFATVLLRRLEKSLQKTSGRTRRRDETPGEYVASMNMLTTTQRSVVDEALWAYYETRFGGRKRSRIQVVRLLRIIRAAFRSG